MATIPAAAEAAEPEAAIGLGEVNRHLIAFQRFADRNGHHRGSGTAGYDESANYVATKLIEAGFDVTRHEFPFSYVETLAERLVVGGTPVPIIAMKYTASSPVGGITAALVVVRTPGCTAADYANLDVRDKIVLIKRGDGCLLRGKEKAAADAGAAGLVVYNNVPGNLRGQLDGPGIARIPTGGITQAAGEALLPQDGATTNLEIREKEETRISYNVIAETKTGRKDKVIMAGGHLDSVQRGPGINDNGSGSAALLANALRKGGSPKVENALRFAWWSAEELGLLGSVAYVRSLSPEQRANIALYMNFDMLASPNGGYFVMDGDDSEHDGAGPGPAGSAEIEQAFLEHFAATGVPTEPTDLDDSSDQGEFINAGIPSGGIDTGAALVKTDAQAAKWGGTAGQPFDSCYHEFCDNLGNLDRVALVRNTNAIRLVLNRFAGWSGALS